MTRRSVIAALAAQRASRRALPAPPARCPMHAGPAARRPLAFVRVGVGLYCLDCALFSLGRDEALSRARVVLEQLSADPDHSIWNELDAAARRARGG